MESDRFYALMRTALLQRSRRGLVRISAALLTGVLFSGQSGFVQQGAAKKKKRKRKPAVSSPPPAGPPLPPPPPPPPPPGCSVGQAIECLSGLCCPMDSPQCCPTREQSAFGDCAEPNGTCCPSGRFPSVCPAALPKCCQMADQDAPDGHCTAQSSTCCTTDQGGGSCSSGYNCCQLTHIDTQKRCAEEGGTCCSADSGGGVCPASAPQCCPHERGLGCCPNTSQCCFTSADCTGGQTCNEFGCCVSPGSTGIGAASSQSVGSRRVGNHRRN